MDLDEIKEIIEADGGRFIVLENGKPIIVITSFVDFKKNYKIVKAASQERIISKKPIPKELLEEPLKIEDLPF